MIRYMVRTELRYPKHRLTLVEKRPHYIMGIQIFNKLPQTLTEIKKRTV